MNRAVAIFAALAGLTVFLAVEGWRHAGSIAAATRPASSAPIKTGTTPAVPASMATTSAPAVAPVASIPPITIAGHGGRPVPTDPAIRALEQQGYKMGVDNLAGAVAHMNTLPPSERAAFLTGVLRAMNELAKLDAFKLVPGDGKKDLDSRRDRAKTESFLAAIATHLTSPEDRKRALIALLNLSNSNKSQLNGEPPGGSGESALATVVAWRLTENGKLSPEGLQLMSREFGIPAPDRAQILGQFANALIKGDPARAFALGDEFVGEEQRTFTTLFAAGWAASDATAAWQWSAGITDPALQDEVRTTILKAQARKDLTGALARLNDIPAGTPLRQQGLTTLAEIWSKKDPATAQQWINAMPDPEEQRTARATFDKTAIGGIGIALNWDEKTGAPFVREVLPQSVSGAAQTLREGDQIIAVASKPGQWTKAAGMQSTDFINIVRGPGDTPVWLQILPANSPPGTPPRILMLRRQWIKQGD